MGEDSSRLGGEEPQSDGADGRLGAVGDAQLGNKMLYVNLTSGALYSSEGRQTPSAGNPLVGHGIFLLSICPCEGVTG